MGDNITSYKESGKHGHKVRDEEVRETEVFNEQRVKFEFSHCQGSPRSENQASVAFRPAAAAHYSTLLVLAAHLADSSKSQ